jgi:hypothetical protein
MHIRLSLKTKTRGFFQIHHMKFRHSKIYVPTVQKRMAERVNFSSVKIA